MKSKNIYIYIYIYIYTALLKKTVFMFSLTEFDAINNSGNYKTYYDIYLSGLKS